VAVTPSRIFNSAAEAVTCDPLILIEPAIDKSPLDDSANLTFPDPVLMINLFVEAFSNPVDQIREPEEYSDLGPLALINVCAVWLEEFIDTGELIVIDVEPTFGDKTLVLKESVAVTVLAVNDPIRAASPVVVSPSADAVSASVPKISTISFVLSSHV